MRMLKSALLAFAMVALPLAAYAQNATISAARARAIALKAVPNNQGVKSEKLKTEDGVLVYVVDVATPGPGHREVRVNARTGVVVENKAEGNVVERTAQKTGKAVEKGAKATAKAAEKVGKGIDKQADKIFSKDEVKTMRVPVSESRARTIALRQVPGGTVKDTDLKREKGVVLWEVKVDGPGKLEQKIRIDANTGAVISRKR